MRTMFAALIGIAFAGSVAGATARQAPVAKPAPVARATTKNLPPSTLKRDIERETDKKYFLGGPSDNSHTITLKGNHFRDSVFEGPGSPDPTITGTVNLRNGKLVKTRITNND